MKAEYRRLKKTAAVLLIGGGTTYAAWRYLTPQEAAVELKDQKLAEAFSGEGEAQMEKLLTCKWSR